MSPAHDAGPRGRLRRSRPLLPCAALGSARRMVAALPCRRHRRRCGPFGPRALRAPGLETRPFRRRATPSRFLTAVVSVQLELRGGRELLPLDILPRSAAVGARGPARFPSGPDASTFPGRAFPDAGVSGASLRDRAACRASSRAACQPCSLALRVAGGMAADLGPSGGIPRAVLAARSGTDRLASPRSRCRWQCPITDAGDRDEPDRALSDPAAGMRPAMNTRKTPGAIRLRRGCGP